MTRDNLINRLVAKKLRDMGKEKVFCICNAQPAKALCFAQAGRRADGKK